MGTWSQHVSGFTGSSYYTKRTAFCKNPSTELDTPWGCDLPEYIASWKVPSWRQMTEGGSLTICQLMTALPSGRSNLGDSWRYLDMTEHWRGVEGPIWRFLSDVNWDTNCFGVSLPIVTALPPSMVLQLSVDRRQKAAALQSEADHSFAMLPIQFG